MYRQFKQFGQVLETSVGQCRFLLARRYASAGNSDRNVSVRPSVCPSVTRRHCVKTKKASGMISSPSDSPKTLVFWRQISLPNYKGFTRTGASNKGRSGKFSDSLALSVNISKTVADRAKVTIRLVTNRKSYMGSPPRTPFNHIWAMVWSGARGNIAITAL